MRKILVGLMLASSALGTSAHASDAGPYITIEGGVVKQERSNVSGPGGYEHADRFRAGWEAGGALGYDFGHFRLEAEGFYARSNLRSQSRPVGTPQPNGEFTSSGSLSGRASA